MLGDDTVGSDVMDQDKSTGIAIRSLLEDALQGSPHLQGLIGSQKGKEVFGNVAPSAFFVELYDNGVSPTKAISAFNEIVLFAQDKSGDLVDTSGIIIVPGEYRTYDVTCGDYLPPRPGEAQDLMQQFISKLDVMTMELLDKSKAPNGELYLLGHINQLITFAGVSFMAIHPFGDGNGRTGRALMDYLEYYVYRKLGYEPLHLRQYSDGMTDERLSEFKRRNLPNAIVDIINDFWLPKGVARRGGQPAGKASAREYVEFLRRMDGYWADEIYYSRLSQNMRDFFESIKLNDFENPLWIQYGNEIARSRNRIFDLGETVPLGLVHLFNRQN